jgi:hypothetical protein
VKVQIRRLSPHQNGKVAALLLLVVSLPLFVFMALMIWLGGPQLEHPGSPLGFGLFMFLVLPFFYVIFAYLAVAFVCAVYNMLCGFTGGFEFELAEPDPSAGAEGRG